MKRIDEYFVYIVKCKKETYYTGYTNNLENRLKLHSSGHGAKYLRGKSPIKLVYCKAYKYYKSVLNMEREIKSYTRKEKEQLINAYEKNA